MLRLAIALFVLAPLAAACPACEFPFSAESEGTVVFPLGAVGDCTSNDNGSVPANGEPDEDGNLTTFTHTNDGTTCSLNAAWSGRLLDMAAVRTDIDSELEEAGVDPATVTLRIVSMTPSVSTIVLRDDADDSPIDLDSSALTGYRGAISVDGDAEIIVAEYTGGGDPTVPDVKIKDSAKLVELANASFTEGADLLASGTGDTEIAMTNLADIQSAGQPALVVTFIIGVEGAAALGGAPAE